MLRDLPETQLRRFLAKIRRAARRIVKDDARADDAQQEAALALLEAEQRSEPVRSAAGFAAVLGRNKALDQARKSRRRKTVPLAGAAGRAAKKPSPASKLSRGEECAGLEARLAAELSETERAVFTLKVVEDRTVTEIAARLGLSTKTVSRAYYRASKKLGRLA
jgi:RNA polymerase sigma factor (sigma-70 family)